MKKSIPIHEYILPVSIEEDETGGFIATCPVWDDCYAQGDTVEDVAKEIQQVASSLIKLYEEENLIIPLEKKALKNRFSKPLSFELPIVISLNN